MKTVIVIPARFASSRLPEKMLVKVQGKPIIQWTYEAVCQAPVDQVIIAVDHPKLLECVSGFGAAVIMTSVHHLTGTDRIVEVVRHLNLEDQDIVVNVQGDEPLIPVGNVMQLVHHMQAMPHLPVATLCEKIHHLEEVMSPSITKVVRDHENFALYFSRAPIPWVRGAFPEIYPESHIAYRHLGLYAYRASFLKNYEDLKPAPLENAEVLEQLRILYNGFKIHVDEAKHASGPGIDTAEDIERFKQLLK